MLDVGIGSPQPSCVLAARPGLGTSGPARARLPIFSTGSDTQVSGEMFPDSGPVRIRDPSLSSAQRVLGNRIPYAYRPGPAILGCPLAQRAVRGGVSTRVSENGTVILK